jgi:hypothetical protein
MPTDLPDEDVAALHEGCHKAIVALTRALREARAALVTHYDLMAMPLSEDDAEKVFATIRNALERFGRDRGDDARGVAGVRRAPRPS